MICFEKKLDKAVVGREIEKRESKRHEPGLSVVRPTAEILLVCTITSLSSIPSTPGIVQQRLRSAVANQR